MTTREVTVEVKSAAAVEGRYGPQWQLEAQPPWSMFPTKFWVDRFQGAEAPTPGLHICLMEQGMLRPGKGGDHEYDYNWKIISIDTPGDTEVAPPHDPNIAEVRQATASPAQWADSPMKPDHPTKRRSIERQVARTSTMEYRMRCIEATLKLMAEFGDTTRMNAEQVLEDANQYWNWVTEEKALDIGYTWIAKPHAQTPSGPVAQSSGDITSMPPDDYVPAPPDDDFI
jgi:hypothetical protein